MSAASCGGLDDIARVDWDRVAVELDAEGSAVLERLLSPAECEALRALYRDPSLFRSRVMMARHGFGRGEYQYFAHPIPVRVAALRAALYRALAPIANRWNEALRIDVRFPADHGEFIARCHAAGQTRPTAMPPSSP